MIEFPGENTTRQHSLGARLFRLDPNEESSASSVLCCFFVWITCFSVTDLLPLCFLDVSFVVGALFAVFLLAVSFCEVCFFAGCRFLFDVCLPTACPLVIFLTITFFPFLLFAV